MEDDGIKKTFLRIILNKKYQLIATILLLIIVLITSSYIRVQNLPLLVDQTTEQNIPLALDPFYFLRVAETLVQNNGVLPSVDSLRSPSINIGWSSEILPKVLVLMYKITRIFNPKVTLAYVDLIYPVIFFAIGLIIFFILIYFLTKSKSISLLSSIFLSLVPTYLYRTMAGFSDHEAIGILTFFCFLISITLSLKIISKENFNIKRSLLTGSIVGLFSALTIASWGGVSTFVFMITPLSFFILWNIKLRKENKNNFGLNALIFYTLWAISTIFFASLLGTSPSHVIPRFISTSGIISLFVLGFSIIDLIILFNLKKLKIINEKYRQAYSLIIAIILGSILLGFIGKNIFSLLGKIWVRLFHPWGVERISLTVAENAQPYLVDWINQSGKFIFWMFFGGLIFFGNEIVKSIKQNKDKIIFMLIWILMISSILFSRISPTSFFNGTNFISQLFYITGVGIFLGYLIWLYFAKEFKIKTELIIIFSWMFFILISGRAAARMFFAITPFVCFSASFFVIKTFEYFKKAKEDLVKMAFGILFILLLILSLISIQSFYISDSQQAKYTGPSANAQWQNAMQWVRENTSKRDVFVHWWDYGYWVQSLGKHPTVSDGGHAQTVFNGDHYIGRYVLTTPYPETALSFMKSWNVSYLLIDPSDLGKYPAYSKIGSDNSGTDRYSAIPIMLSDPKQTIETSNKTIMVFSGGSYLFEDIIYNENEKNIFLPSGKAAVIAIIVNLENNSLGQPEAVYLYNGVQTRIPVRYLYYKGQLMDYKTGLDAVIDVLPSFEGQSINPFGAIIYLSQKVSKSLFAQLYLLDDAFNNYPTIKIAHIESNAVTKSLRNSGYNGGEFIYYQGFRGPIKIWKVNYPSNIIENKEFLEYHSWGELDNLQFITQ